ncbi:MAG: ABC transporter ATP-binding protein [Desulfobacteraceae bacterium]|nr:MAG: ABC transporter ATP-binding protein [Desulfobacteraceae bacterium]
MLELEQVHTFYGNIHALKGISLHIMDREIVTLIGSNGAGKSTLLNTISGITRSREGRILLGERRIEALSPHRIVREGISQVPEGRKIFSRLTVGENLEMGAFTRKDGKGIQRDTEIINGLFPKLQERKRQVAGTLSGGEQQMLAIARALMARPRILLLDEPSMGLAPVLVELIFEKIQRINEEGTTILLVEQNAMMAFQIASRGYLMQTGRIVLHDTSANLQNNDLVKELYLGGKGE